MWHCFCLNAVSLSYCCLFLILPLLLAKSPESFCLPTPFSFLYLASSFLSFLSHLPVNMGLKHNSDILFNSAGHHHFGDKSVGHRAAGISASVCHEIAPSTNRGGVLVAPGHHHVPGTLHL
jgi:hypothetical protein